MKFLSWWSCKAHFYTVNLLSTASSHRINFQATRTVLIKHFVCARSGSQRISYCPHLSWAWMLYLQQLGLDCDSPMQGQLTSRPLWSPLHPRDYALPEEMCWPMCILGFMRKPLTIQFLPSKPWHPLLVLWMGFQGLPALESQVYAKTNSSSLIH